MSFIELHGISIRRGKRPVLINISFSVDRGQVVSITGPSGSGKSTLLRCINRLAEIDKGRIIVSGKDIRAYDPPVLRRALGMVFQFPAVFQGTVSENIEYGLKVWNIRSKDRVIKALEDVGLDRSFLKRRADKLSGGEQQRVCLARALAIDSKALLLDEPTISLDTKSTEIIEGTIMELKKTRNLAIVWVTHDSAQADRISDRHLVLENGRIGERGGGGNG